ncbi:Putative flippase GtrA (transmembrane translocase of bactoprenol-linked glucose) [Streptomyces indicus]|uniref:Putative flippase GtrA (Transmembrane translocase of bactoprenol-linked glucose) n=2 Tax=Streptomyces indicus TaxID=417292 RepID=A0A1G9EHU9_9ACTN|nr:Putative flippase GtrA (transmembrane translocase of bactoprenol-linked glucose) [Streptomyces indicus]
MSTSAPPRARTDGPAERPGLLARLRAKSSGLAARLRAMGPELLGFAAAGICAYAADLGLFIWLRGPLGWDPLTAKALSFVAGCSVAYAGNALGTYRGRTPGVSRMRQYAVFFAVNIAGALVQLLCLAVSHYGLGYTSPRADTISGAGVGMALATVLRFWGTRSLVFRTAGKAA